MSEITAMLDGSVGDVKVKLAGLSADQLAELRAAEAAGQKRSTLLAAIDDAIRDAASHPGDTGGATGANGATGADVARTYSQAQVDGMIAEALAKHDDAATGAEATFTREQVDQMLTEREAAWKADTERQVADARGAAAPTPAKVEPATALAIDTRSRGPALSALIGGANVVFVDQHDFALPGVAPLTFPADAFEPAGDNAVKLKKDVDFPNSLAANEVVAAFLLNDDGDAIGKARLIGAQPIGGGRDVRLPGGTLLFTKE